MSLLGDIRKDLGTWEDQLGDIRQLIDTAEETSDPIAFMEARKRIYQMQLDMIELCRLLQTEEVAPDVEEIFQAPEHEEDM